MIQKLLALFIGILGVLIFYRSGSIFGFILICIAFPIYRGADHGVWFYFDWESNSESGFGDSSDAGGDGGGD